MSRPRIVVLLVDALGWEAVQMGVDGPWLGDLLPHRRPLETILGFSSGAIPALLTGSWPRQNGRWLMYRRAASDSPLTVARLFARLPERVRRSYRMSQLLHAAVARRVRGYFALYDIPWSRLPLLDLPEVRDLYAPGAVPGHPSWFDDWTERRYAVRVWDWRTPEAENAAAFLSAAESDATDVLFWYTPAQDALRHRHGNEADEVRGHLRGLGETLRRAAEKLSARGPAPWVYVFSDHGMTDVVFHVDLMGEVQAAVAGTDGADSEGRAWLAFYDSTLARFWWPDPDARRRLRPLVQTRLAGLGAGHWLDDEECRRYGVDFPDRRFGEDIYLVRPGGLVVPSYMGHEPVRGMHGYRPEEPTSRAIFLSNRPVPDGVRHVVDVRAHLLEEWDRHLACRRS